VAISTDSRETSTNTADNGGTPVTVASNLPSGNTGGSNTSAKSNTSETRELVNYEISQTTRKLTRRPDTIKRLSVAVLINGITTPGATPAWTPRSDAELTSLRELVQSTVGFNAERGDVITVKSLQFLPLAEVGTAATPSPFAGVAANSITLIQTGVLALVILGLGMFVVRPILTSPALTALPGPDPLDGAFPAMEDDLQFAIAGPDDPLSEGFSNDPVSQLRQIIAERQGETVDVLRNWIETSEESA
jgi:flagellar M-ring protein FliF